MKLKETALAAAALALVSTSANARPHHRDHRPLKILIETVDHQRYPTAGDWQLKPDGLHILVSRMSDQRYEFLVGMHEAIEAYLCKQAGISQVAVDRFDQAYERRRKPGDDSDPGDDPKRPATRSICSLPRSNACSQTSWASAGTPTIARFPASEHLLFQKCPQFSRELGFSRNPPTCCPVFLVPV